MKIQKPIISKQVSIEQITKSCNYDVKNFTEKFFNFQYTWLNNAYGAFKDFDKYIILVYLINKTLKTYKEHFFNLSFEDFYKSESFEIEKLSIIEIVEKLFLSKETARRKINELNKSGIIRRDKKNIFILNPFKYQKPINNIKEMSKLLASTSINLNKIYGIKSFEDAYFENVIKKNYTHYWHVFLNFQLNYIIRQKLFFESIDCFYIFGACVLNQSFNLKNSNFSNKEKLINLINFPSLIAEFTKLKSYGLNPTTISELTGIPRASVIRKVKILVNKKLLVKDNDNLLRIVSPKDNPKEFKKISKIFIENQLLIRNCLKDLINKIII